ncbi:hypothetical protein V2O64_15200 [Verrucomicrobiaceae bacterium 227]
MSPAPSCTMTSTDWRQFVPGPVPISPHLLAIGDRQLPYNRSQPKSLYFDLKSEIESRRVTKAGPGFGMKANLRWFAGEQRKVFSFDEGVFIFMLSVALIFNALTVMLWVFAVSQVFYGIARSIQRARKLHLNQSGQILTTTEK